MKRDERANRELEHEITRTRARVERELRALEQRLSPGHLFEQAVARLRSDGGREFMNNLGRSVRENPVPVALTALGLTWLALTRAGQPQRAAQNYGAQHNGEALGASLQGAGERVQGALHNAGERARQLSRQAQQKGQQLGERARELGEQLGWRSAQGEPGTWNSELPAAPLLWGIAAVGAALGAAVCASRARAQGAGAQHGREREHVARTRRNAQRMHGEQPYSAALGDTGREPSRPDSAY